MNTTKTNIINKSIATLLTTLLLTSTVFAWERGKSETFALLPQNSSNTEAITADANGNIYASTFFSGEIHQFSTSGELISSIAVMPSSGSLTDLAFHPLTNALLVIDFGGKKVLEVNPVTGNATTFADIPGGANAGPNVLTFDAQGNTYVSDSYQGIIWRIPVNGGIAEVWVKHKLLTTSGFPPFGANGLAFNNDYSKMYIANTGEDSIIQITIDNQGNAGTPKVLVNGINGPDGLIVDEKNNIMVVANQSNQIIVLDSTGKAISVLGDFKGISKKGIVKGLLMPSDIVKVGKNIYVTNFALDVTLFGLDQSYTTAYTKMVKRHSITRIQIEKDETD